MVVATEGSAIASADLLGNRVSRVSIFVTQTIYVLSCVHKLCMTYICCLSLAEVLDKTVVLALVLSSGALAFICIVLVSVLLYRTNKEQRPRSRYSHPNSVKAIAELDPSKSPLLNPVSEIPDSELGTIVQEMKRDAVIFNRKSGGVLIF